MSEASTTAAKSVWRSLFGWLFYILFLTGFTFAGAMAKVIGASSILKAVVIQRWKNTPPSEIFGSDHLTILVLGCDDDLEYGGKVVRFPKTRSDMMMVVKADFANQQLTGLSIPRDTLFALDGKTHKINAYHAYGVISTYFKQVDLARKSGADPVDPTIRKKIFDLAVKGGNALSKRAIEGMLGLKIDRVVVLDFNAFQEMVNIVGGVTLKIDKVMKYTDKAGGLFIDLKPGVQRLDGYKAMGFVRFRHSDSDLLRQQRQRQFVLAFKNELVHQPFKLGAVADKAIDVLGAEFTADEAASLGLFAQRLKPTAIRLGTVPVKERGKSIVLDSTKLERTLTEFGLSS